MQNEKKIRKTSIAMEVFKAVTLYYYSTVGGGVYRGKQKCISLVRSLDVLALPVTSARLIITLVSINTRGVIEIIACVTYTAV